MIIEKNEIIELQKAISKKIEELHKSSSPDSAELFDLNMLDSNISLFLLAAEFKDDPVELKSSDKLIINALKKFRKYSSDENNSANLIKESTAAASELLDLIKQFEDRLEDSTEKILAENLKLRFDSAYTYLQQIASLKNETKKNLKAWMTQEIPLSLSNAGKTLGKARTEKKAASSRENGKKGGRPPKAETTKKAAGKKPAAENK